MGYVSKSSDESELLRAVEAVAAGDVYVESDLLYKMFETQRIMSVFTKKERKIVEALLLGDSTAEIAEKLGVDTSSPIEEIKDEDVDIQKSIEKMHEIANAIKSSKAADVESEPIASQKSINEAIDSAIKEEEKEEIPEISEAPSITDAILKKDEEAPKEETTIQETLTPFEEEKPEEEPKEEIIKEPTLKSPTKIEEDSVSILSGADEDYEFGANIDSSNLFEDENGELSDLDYRKDLAKITNTLKNSSILKDIRGKLIQEPEAPSDELNEDFIRNVNTYTEEAYEVYNDYDDYAPIINETHVDYIEPTPEEALRQENTRKVFNAVKETADVVEEEKAIPTPKEKPERSSLKIKINNNEEVLRKGDEIIFNHEGETYSSKVYAINGDDIKVKYRRQNITIKSSDIKKIY